MTALLILKPWASYTFGDFSLSYIEAHIQEWSSGQSVNFETVYYHENRVEEKRIDYFDKTLVEIIDFCVRLDNDGGDDKQVREWKKIELFQDCLSQIIERKFSESNIVRGENTR